MIKRFVFWQNIISPHYSSFFKSLSNFNGIEVELIVNSESLKEREKMGWEIPDTGKTKVIIRPSIDQIDQILKKDKESSVHIFSGTRGYPLVWIALKQAIKERVRIGLMSETGNWIGIKGKLRLLRSSLDRILFGKYISFILAIGHTGVSWYKKSGYSENIIFDWAYFVNKPSKNLQKFELKNSSAFNILFVGRLSHEKGVEGLIQTLAKIKENFHLTIIGDGPRKKDISKAILNCNLNDKIETLNFLLHHKIFEAMGSADLVVLPSIGKDGWGAVTNEALLVGTPVIVSTFCGSSDMIKDPLLGQVFDPQFPNSLLHVLSNCIQKGKSSESERSKIQKWASRIEGASAADYFLRIIKYVEGTSINRPNAPWK